LKHLERNDSTTPSDKGHEDVDGVSRVDDHQEKHQDGKTQPNPEPAHGLLSSWAIIRLTWMALIVWGDSEISMQVLLLGSSTV
jgi:hypothetical protein